jgi:hypothetical protein
MVALDALGEHGLNSVWEDWTSLAIAPVILVNLYVAGYLIGELQCLRRIPTVGSHHLAKPHWPHSADQHAWRDLFEPAIGDTVTPSSICPFIFGHGADLHVGSYRYQTLKILMDELGPIRGVHALGCSLPAGTIAHPVHRIIGLLRRSRTNSRILGKLLALYPEVDVTATTTVAITEEEEKVRAEAALKLLDHLVSKYTPSKKSDTSRNPDDPSDSDDSDGSDTMTKTIGSMKPANLRAGPSRVLIGRGPPLQTKWV